MNTQAVVEDHDEVTEMIEFFQAGGYSMFMVLLFGVLALVAAAAFVRKPEERHVGMIRALSVATVFSVVAGFCANLAAVMSQVPQHPEWAHSPDVNLIVMTGIGESLAPGIMGFTMLALVWLVTAAGVRRLSAVAV